MAQSALESYGNTGARTGSMQTLPTKLPEIRGSTSMSRSGTGTKSAFGLNKMTGQRAYNISVGEIVAQGSGKAKFVFLFDNNIEYNF